MAFWTELVPISPANLNSSTVPVGGIIMYSGLVGDLPTNWNLCDGTSGTPDLRGRFVVGAEGTYSQGDTGGADSVTLGATQLPDHNHIVPGQVGTSSLDHSDDGRFAGSAGGAGQFNILAPQSGVNGQAHENRPPYYALAFIMRTA